LTTWCFHHRRIVVPLWILALVVVSVISAVGGADSRDNFALPGTSSQRA
jgi:RND superfamily putative drug exporter